MLVAYRLAGDLSAYLLHVELALRLALGCPQYLTEVLVLRVEDLVVYLWFGLAVIRLSGLGVHALLLVLLEQLLLRRAGVLHRLVELLALLLVRYCHLVGHVFNVPV